MLTTIKFILRVLTFLFLMEGVSLAINVLQLFSLPLHRPLYRLYRVYIRLTERLFGSLMTIITYLLCPVELVMYGDHASLRNDERVILTSNHQTLVDWWYIWLLGWSKGAHGDIRIILKDSLKWVPIVGWGMQFFEFIFLSRRIQVDEPRLRSSMVKIRSLIPSSKTSQNTPYHHRGFLSGSSSSLKAPKIQRVRRKNNIPLNLRPKHTILPRSTGYRICLEELVGRVESRESETLGLPPAITTIYDITVGFEGEGGDRGRGTPDDPAYDRFPILDVFFGGKGPKKVHMYVRTFPLSDLPEYGHAVRSLGENGKMPDFDEWLGKLYREKDELMDGFYKEGKFPDDGKKVVTVGIVPRLTDWLGVMGVVVVAWQIIAMGWWGIRMMMWVENIYYVLMFVISLCIVSFTLATWISAS
ncbi:hypothetical protein BC829DRAFT_412191 [Chytridium lagenaria]|nr:hypothetical protein BC829DRAFT_412191 [Chytridium lagenaria]